MAENFKDSLTQLNQIIEKLEVTTGSAHQPQPQVTVTNTTVPKQAQVKTEQKPKVQAPKEQPKVEKKQEKKEEKKQVKKEEKKQTKPAEKADKKKEEQLPEGTVDDFAQIDIRVGEIKECWKHPESDNLYCEKIDIGEQNIREIGSGLQKYVPIDQMSGPVLVMANLKPRKLAGFMSNGMVVANSNDDHTQIYLVVPKGAKVGERVVLEGFEDKFSQDRQPELNPKKKILEKCIGKLATDAEGAAIWNGHKLKTSAGYIFCTIPNAHLS